MQYRNPRRPVNGLFLLDKITGVSSNAALQRVKRIYQAEKAGHTGSLDPLASGLLPICLGEATKFSQFLLDADKRYQVTGQLGVRTDSADADGKVIASRPVAVTREQLEQVLPAFIGPQLQLPPMYSALKKDGKPLYELARQGIEIEREPRPITIFSCTLLDFSGDHFTLDVHCSKGTYIRTLVDDIGERLGCGAHVTVLRRTAAGAFTLEQAHSSDQAAEILEQQGQAALDALLLPVDALLTHLPSMIFAPALVHFLRQGQPVFQKGAPRDGLVVMRDGEGKFFGVGEMDDDGRVAPKRMIRDS